MDYEFNKTQKIVKDEARRFLSRECPSDLVREMAEDEIGYSRKMWQKMAELDWMGTMIPEQYDGMGGSFLDMTVLLSEMGYHCTPGPFFATVVLGGYPAEVTGTGGVKSKDSRIEIVGSMITRVL